MVWGGGWGHWGINGKVKRDKKKREGRKSGRKNIILKSSSTFFSAFLKISFFSNFTNSD